MPADPEMLRALARIETTLASEAARSAEDRKAGIQAREKIDEIHTSQQLTTQALSAHIVAANQYFADLRKSVDHAHERVDRVKVTKNQAGAAVGGAGVFGVLLDRLWNWFSGTGGH